MDKLDYKKVYKNLYQPKCEPSIINVETMNFIQIDGQGNPNDSDGEYQKAVAALYALAYTIKMFPKSGHLINGYFEYVVPPLEGFWWLDNGKEFDYHDKSALCWTAMIRQPEFVTQEVFSLALEVVKKKKTDLDLSGAQITSFTEGLCVQCLHIGSFDEEPKSITKMKQYMNENGWVSDLSAERRHHEVYLSDPRKVDSSKLKTILRHPVK